MIEGSTATAPAPCANLPPPLGALSHELLAQIITHIPNPRALACTCRAACAAVDAAAQAWFRTQAPQLAPHRAPPYRALTWRRLQGLEVPKLADVITELSREPGCGGHTSGSAAGGSFSSATAGDTDPKNDPYPGPTSSNLVAVGRLYSLCPEPRLLLVPYAAAGGHERLVSALLPEPPPTFPHLQIGPNWHCSLSARTVWAAGATLKRIAATGVGNAGGGSGREGNGGDAAMERQLAACLQKGLKSDQWNLLLAHAVALGEPTLRCALAIAAKHNMAGWVHLRSAATLALRRTCDDDSIDRLCGPLTVVRAAAPSDDAFVLWLASMVASHESDVLLRQPAVEAILMERLRATAAAEAGGARSVGSAGSFAPESRSDSVPDGASQAAAPSGLAAEVASMVLIDQPTRAAFGTAQILSLVAGKALFRGDTAMLRRYINAAADATAAAGGSLRPAALAAAGLHALAGLSRGGCDTYSAWCVTSGALLEVLEEIAAAAKRLGCETEVVGALVAKPPSAQFVPASWEGAAWVAEQRRQLRRSAGAGAGGPPQQQQQQQQQASRPAATRQQMLLPLRSLRDEAFRDLCNMLIGDFGQSAAERAAAAVARALSSVREAGGPGANLVSRALLALDVRRAIWAGDAAAAVTAARKLKEGGGGTQPVNAAAFAASAAADAGDIAVLSALWLEVRSGGNTGSNAGWGPAAQTGMLAAAVASALRAGNPSVLLWMAGCTVHGVTTASTCSSLLGLAVEALIAAAVAGWPELVLQWGPGDGTHHLHDYLACCIEDARNILWRARTTGGPHMGAAPPVAATVDGLRLLLRIAPPESCGDMFSHLLVGFGAGPDAPGPEDFATGPLGLLLRWLADCARRGPAAWSEHSTVDSVQKQTPVANVVSSEAAADAAVDKLPPGARLARPFAVPFLLEGGGWTPDDLAATAAWLAAAKPMCEDSDNDSDIE